MTISHDENSTRGGTRKGAGRKAFYNEPTTVLRVPVSKVQSIKDWLLARPLLTDLNSTLLIQPVEITTELYEIPVMLNRVSAGFPSPAADYVERTIDLNKELIGENKTSTFIVTVESRSMLNIGIDIDDRLIVDRSITPKHRSIVLALINGEYTVKRLIIEGEGDNRKVWLSAENPEYESIYPKEGDDFRVWGVVKHVLKALI